MPGCEPKATGHKPKYQSKPEGIRRPPTTDPGSRTTPNGGGRRRTLATIKNHREFRDCKKETVEKTTYDKKTTGNHIMPRPKEPSSEKPDITPGIRNTKNLATTTHIRGTQVTEAEQRQHTPPWEPIPKTPQTPRRP